MFHSRRLLLWKSERETRQNFSKLHCSEVDPEVRYVIFPEAEPSYEITASEKLTAPNLIRGRKILSLMLNQ